MSRSENVIAAFLETAGRRGSNPCVRFKEAGAWQTLNWTQMAQSILGQAASLKKIGLKRGERVVLFAQTCLGWTQADCAILAAGGVTVPIYPSLNAEGVAHILKDSEPSMAIVEDEGLLRTYQGAVASDPALSSIPLFTLKPIAEYRTMLDLEQEATDDDRCQIESFLHGISSEEIATIVYTSGTTGRLKGVVLSHGNLQAEIRADQEVFRFATTDVGLLCLPLAHVLGRMMQFYQLIQGCEAVFAESIAKLAENYVETRPHFVCAVPRMLEKIYENVGIYRQGLATPFRQLVTWSLAIGRKRSQLLQKHRPVGTWLALRWRLADLLFFRRLRRRLGGRLHTFICGGAYLPQEIAEFFHAVGILVQEGYGLTETFAAATVNSPDDYHFGTVGKPLPGVELTISKEGELLIRGPTVFREYLGLPEETRTAFTEDGWFRTGDLGEYSRDGFIRITGRCKDIIITAGGKNVAPQPIERVMSASPLIDHFLLCGEGRRFISALITLNEEGVRSILRERGIPLRDKEPLSQHPEVQRLVEEVVQRGNEGLSAYETVKRFIILDEPFTIEGGELTPSMKVRRKAICEKYSEALEGLYQER